MDQIGTHVGPSGSKGHQHGSKWVRMRLKAVKSGQKRPKGPQNGPKWPKMAFSKANLPKSLAWWVPQHSGVGTLGTGTAQRRVFTLSVHGFHEKVYIG